MVKLNRPRPKIQDKHLGHIEVEEAVERTPEDLAQRNKVDYLSRKNRDG